MGLATFGLAVIVNILNLPPFLGIIFGLGIVAIAIDLKLKSGKLEKKSNWVINLIKYIDMATINYFVGILLAVNALTYQGILNQMQILFLVPIREKMTEGIFVDGKRNGIWNFGTENE